MTCAHAVSVAMNKLPGVEKVYVTLQKGTATLELKLGNSITVPQLWEIIQKTGFTPRVTTVELQGTVQLAGATPQLNAGSTTYDLHAPGNLSDLLHRSIGKPVIMHGTFTPAKDKKARVPLEVTSIR